MVLTLCVVGQPVHDGPCRTRCGIERVGILDRQRKIGALVVARRIGRTLLADLAHAVAVDVVFEHIDRRFRAVGAYERVLAAPLVEQSERTGIVFLGISGTEVPVHEGIARTRRLVGPDKRIAHRIVISNPDMPAPNDHIVEFGGNDGVTHDPGIELYDHHLLGTVR